MIVSRYRPGRPIYRWFYLYRFRFIDVPAPIPVYRFFGDFTVIFPIKNRWHGEGYRVAMSQRGVQPIISTYRGTTWALASHCARPSEPHSPPYVHPPNGRESEDDEDLRRAHVLACQNTQGGSSRGVCGHGVGLGCIGEPTSSHEVAESTETARTTDRGHDELREWVSPAQTIITVSWMNAKASVVGDSAFAAMPRPPRRPTDGSGFHRENEADGQSQWLRHCPRPSDANEVIVGQRRLEELRW